MDPKRARCFSKIEMHFANVHIPRIPAAVMAQREGLNTQL
jgi:hypothetical protein